MVCLAACLCSLCRDVLVHARCILSSGRPRIALADVRALGALLWSQRMGWTNAEMLLVQHSGEQQEGSQARSGGTVTYKSTRRGVRGIQIVRALGTSAPSGKSPAQACSRDLPRHEQACTGDLPVHGSRIYFCVLACVLWHHLCVRLLSCLQQVPRTDVYL